MNQTSLSFTVFFEDPFWIGLFEYRKISCCIGSASYLAVSSVNSWYMHG